MFSFYSVVGKKRTPRFGGIAVTCFSFLFGSVELLAVLLLGRTAAVGGLFASLGLDIFVNVPLFSGIPLSALPALAYICAVNSAAGYVCHMMALEKTSAQEASLIFFLKPMIAPLFAFLFLREEITANMLLGIVCFLVGSGIAILPGLLAPEKAAARLTHSVKKCRYRPIAAFFLFNPLRSGRPRGAQSSSPARCAAAAW